MAGIYANPKLTRPATPGYNATPVFKDEIYGPIPQSDIIYSALPAQPETIYAEAPTLSESEPLLGDEIIYAKAPPLYDTFWQKHKVRIILVLIVLAIIVLAYFIAAAWTNSWTLGVKHSCVDDTLGWTPWTKRTCVL